MDLKKILIFFLCSIAAISCDKSEENVNPVLTSTTIDDEISVPDEGGEYSITYTITNPADDGKIEAFISSGGEDWIDNVDSETMGVVKFTALQNVSDEIRTTSIKVSYTYAGGEEQSFSVRITQEAAESSDNPDPDDPDDPDDPEVPSEAPFTITILGVTYSTAEILIEPDDYSMPYIVWVDIADKIEGVSDDELFAIDMQIAESTASMLGMDLYGYISWITKNGEQNNTQSKLDPDTEYAVWCYGIDNSGSYPERTTDIAREMFTTEVLEITENGITLDVEVTDDTFSAVATPYTNDRYYNLNWNSESVLQQEGFTEGTPAERCYQFELDYMTEYSAFYPPTSWANVKQGPATTSAVFNKADTYYVFAYFMNDDGTLDGDIYIKTIEYDGNNSTVLDAPRMSFIRGDVAVD